MAEWNDGSKTGRPKSGKVKRTNLHTLFTELSKAAVKIVGGMATAAVAPTPVGVVGGWSTVASAIPDTVAALTNITKPTQEQLENLLVERAMAASVAELAGESLGSMSAQKVGAGVFEQAVAGEEWELAPDFILRPDEVKLLIPVQKRLTEWLLFQGLPEAQGHAKAERLPQRFGIKIHEELTEHKDFFEPLLTALKNEKGAVALEQWAWNRYRAELMREPLRLLFDGKFGLDAVFVPLRAKWREKPRGGERVSHEATEHEVVLQEDLNSWWAKGKGEEDYLRVFSGDPGSGKSSCAKMWAAQMAEHHPGWRVVFVPLHEFDYEGDLREGLKTFLNDKRITADLLEPRSEAKTLLFFDGLDELAMQGRSSREAAVAFVREINTLLSNLNQNARRVLVVLGGRQLVVDDCGTEFRRPHQVLHLEAYSNAECTLWWRKYGTASGNGYTDVPSELQRYDLKNLTEQPLFNYLLALSYDRKRSHNREKLDFSKPVTVNAIYADLMNDVYDRVWGAGGSVHLDGTNKRLEQDEFEEVLEEVGVAVWHSDSRSATLEAIRQRCEAADLMDALEKLENKQEDGVFRLLTAFHFRFKAGRETSVEFTHKSFGEYFTARRIVRLVQTISEQRTQRNKKRGTGWGTTEALVQWAKLCGPQPIDATDTNLFDLLTNEIRAKTEAEREAWRIVLTELVDEMTTQGMPMEQCGLATYKEMDIQARNAEIALLCALYGCPYSDTPQRKLDGPLYAASYVARWRASQWELSQVLLDWNLAYAIVSVICYLGWDISYSDLRGADLRGVDLRRVSFYSADLRRASLCDADLRGADLRDANLRGADLREANLRGARMVMAVLTGATLTNADLRGVDLRRVLDWHRCYDLSLRGVSPERRPEGWESYFHEDGTPMTEAEREKRSAT